ncbi:MAG: alpha/beta hydrolase [Gemmatimonadaceae bacterium]|nr:alpha/beta hydrolase [Gloeobacterales cyanobacterium ES-bin-141]
MVDARPLLIYLPGLDGTGKLFYRQEIPLAAYCEVRALSLPVDDSSSWEDLAARVHTLLPEDPARPVILCGESFGGCIALVAAAMHPERFSRLVLINPATSWRRQTLLSRGANWLTLFPGGIFRGAALVFLPFLAAVNRMKPQDRKILLTTLRLVPASTVLHRLQLLDKLDLEADLSRLTMPVLLVAGAADRLLPSVAEVKYLAERIKDVRVEILPYSGHAALIEAELDLAALLVRYGFLKLADPVEIGRADE